MVVFLLISFTSHGDAPSPKIPPLDSIFGQKRSEKQDVIHFRNNDVLKGEVLNETITVMSPYGKCVIPLRKCAGLSFEGARANTESVITVNYNRITGIVSDRVIKFRIGTSGAPLDIRKEKIRFVLLKRTKDEADFADPKAKTNLFVMANGDLLVGEAQPDKLKIKTDYGQIPVGFNEMKSVQMQGGANVTAVIKKNNGDVMRGTLETEELTVKMDAGVTVEGIYKDKFSKIHIGDGQAQALVKFGMAQPQLGESDGSAFVPAISGDVITNSIGMKFKKIPAGSFMMGSPEDEKGRDDDEGPRHKVIISRPFYIGVYEVTQKQYEKVMGKNPSEYKGSYRPVEEVSWNDAKKFCEKLSEMEGNRTYRLPTEAEWEYACRAGTKTAYYWGDEMDGEYCWYDENSNNTDPVGTRKPNKWGLYDMSGNVWEWCEDWYSNSEYPSFERRDPKGPSSGSRRVNRGGGWRTSPGNCRSANRSNLTPRNTPGALGFRVCLQSGGR